MKERERVGNREMEREGKEGEAQKAMMEGQRCRQKEMYNHIHSSSLSTRIGYSIPCGKVVMLL